MQYNLMIDGVLGIILIAEIMLLCVSFVLSVSKENFEIAELKLEYN